MGNPYRDIFTTPGAAGLAITSAMARLPQAMISIGIITMLVQQSGLYWLAGSVAGTFTRVSFYKICWKKLDLLLLNSHAHIVHILPGA